MRGTTTRGEDSAVPPSGACPGRLLLSACLRKMRGLFSELVARGWHSTAADYCTTAKRFREYRLIRE